MSELTHFPSAFGAHATGAPLGINSWLERLILEPNGFLVALRDAVLRVLAQLVPWLVTAVVVCVGAFVAIRWARRRRMPELGQMRRLRIMPPPEVEPTGGQVLWASLHGVLRPRWRQLLDGQPHLVWEVASNREDVAISMVIPAEIPLRHVEHVLASAWPGAAIVEEPAESPLPTTGHVRASKLTLARPDWFPLGEGPAEDSLRVALGALAAADGDETVVLQIVATPASFALGARLRRRHARSIGRRRAPAELFNHARNVQARLPRDITRDAEEREVHQKTASPLYRCEVRIGVAAVTRGAARMRAHSLASSMSVFQGTNRLEARRMWWGADAIRRHRRLRGFALSVPELARLATLPTGPVLGLEGAAARVIPASRTQPTDGHVLGVSNASLGQRRVAISLADARHHLHIVGETGTGKSTLLANLILQDAEAGRAAIVIDPKGDLIETVLERLPADAEERTCVIDAYDSTNSVGLNVLAGEDADLVADHLVGLFRRIWENHWGPRSEDLLRASCLTLSKIPGATMAEIPLLLTHADWRKAIRTRLKDPALRQFWEQFDAKSEARRQEDIGPLMNKLRSFLLRDSIRSIIGQAEPKQDFEELLETGGLVLVRVPKGLIGQETSKLLGGMVVGRVWQTAMLRARMPERYRQDLTMYVDEVHNYLTLPRSFEDLLAEARGYGLSLVLAHQNMAQLPNDMREALASNARTKVVFACSPQDAKVLEEHFHPTLAAHDLAHLGAHTVACRPCVGGAHGRALTLRTLALPEGSFERARAVRARSAQVYGVPRGLVEAKIHERQRHPERTLLPKERAVRSLDQYGDQWEAQTGERSSSNGVQPREWPGEPA